MSQYSLPDRVAYLLELHGLTQEEAAAKAGISRSTFYRRSRQGAPSPQWIATMEKAFSTTRAEILADTRWADDREGTA